MKIKIEQINCKSKTAKARQQTSLINYFIRITVLTFRDLLLPPAVVMLIQSQCDSQV